MDRRRVLLAASVGNLDTPDVDWTTVVITTDYCEKDEFGPFTYCYKDMGAEGIALRDSLIRLVKAKGEYYVEYGYYSYHSNSMLMNVDGGEYYDVDFFPFTTEGGELFLWNSINQSVYVYPDGIVELEKMI